MVSNGLAVGQANALLVFTVGDTPVAVVTKVVASVAASTDEVTEAAVTYTGPVVFEEPVKEHVGAIILPLLEMIAGWTGIPAPIFDVSVANLDIASARDTGLVITGFSADVPIFLAALSSLLGVEMPKDVASTGHIASTQGDIRMVKSLPAKIHAARTAPPIQRLICPSLDADTSLDILSPKEKREVQEALSSARDDIVIAQVSTVAELLTLVYGEESLVAAALMHGYFETGQHKKSTAGEGLAQTHAFLCDDMENRFWACIENNCQAGHNQIVSQLLTRRMAFHTQRRTYPNGFGTKLFQLLLSLPPTTRKLKLQFPLVGKEHCIALARMSSTGDDFDDVRKLFDAAMGDRFSQTPTVAEAQIGEFIPPDAQTALNTVLTGIASETLARTIGIPVDQARSSYLMDSVIASSHEAFNETISSFYLHLLRHTNGVAASATRESVASEAYALLENAFARRGGVAAAEAEAREGIHGGLRYVLDEITAHHKKTQQTKHVDRVFKEAMGSLDFEVRLTFIKALLERLKPQLPPEVASSPPERFVHHCEPIIQAYIESLEHVRQTLRMS